MQILCEFFFLEKYSDSDSVCIAGTYRHAHFWWYSLIAKCSVTKSYVDTGDHFFECAMIIQSFIIFSEFNHSYDDSWA